MILKTPKMDSICENRNFGGREGGHPHPHRFRFEIYWKSIRNTMKMSLEAH